MRHLFFITAIWLAGRADGGINVAVITSEGPAEDRGAPFRNTISEAIEAVLAAENAP